jgi:hypothetical protein
VFRGPVVRHLRLRSLRGHAHCGPVFADGGEGSLMGCAISPHTHAWTLASSRSAGRTEQLVRPVAAALLTRKLRERGIDAAGGEGHQGGQTSG